MSLIQLIETAGNIVQRKLDATIYEWMRQISVVVDAIAGGGATQQVRYVNKGGNDVTGDGSFDNPFLTVQAAITSITDATATKQYAIIVGPGIYTEVFLLQPWMFVTGLGEGARDVTLSPVQANWIGAGFAAAGSQEAGIVGCVLGTTLNVDFSAVASPGAGVFYLINTDLLGVASNSTGNNVANVVVWKNVNQLTDAAGLTHTFTNILSRQDGVFLRVNNVTFSNNAAYIASHLLGAVTVMGLLTVTCASIANTCIVSGVGLGLNAADATGIVLTGDGAILRGMNVVKVTVVPDADTTFEFAVPAVAGSVHLVDGGDNQLFMLPSAPRTLTFRIPGRNGSRVRFKNQSSTQVVTLVFTSGTTGDIMSYVAPNGYLDCFFSSGAVMIQNPVQSGTVALTNGVSALIPADVTATSNIVATLKTVSGAFGTPVCGGRVVNTRAAGGGFVITSTLPSTGATVATDQGTYDWHVNN
jgi:hypothetical protein